MKLIDELDGQIVKLWRFWSVRWSAVAAACSATVGVYEGFKAVDPVIVKDIPIWCISLLAAGAVLFTLSSMLARGLYQGKNAPTDDQQEHP